MRHWRRRYANWLAYARERDDALSENDLEKPEPDAGEQEATVAEEGEDLPEEQAGGLPLDVNEADAAEQHREVQLDEDEYR